LLRDLRALQLSALPQHSPQLCPYDYRHCDANTFETRNRAQPLTSPNISCVQHISGWTRSRIGVRY